MALQDILKEYERVGTKFAWFAEHATIFSGVLAELAKVRRSIEDEAERLSQELERKERDMRRQQDSDKKDGDEDQPRPSPGDDD